MARQSNHSITWPPISGAAIGAAPITSMLSEKTRAPSSRSNRSRTIACTITGTAQPPTACRKRQTMTAVIDDASAQPAEATR